MGSMIEALRSIVGEKYARDDADSLLTYGRDWTRFYEPHAGAIAFPGTVEQVAAIVRFANDQQLSLVPSGGRTGLSGGAVATRGEVVVSFDRMNEVTNFNEIERTVTVQPGVITQQLQGFAEDHGLFYPVDFASAGSSQLGGNIATNAGGIKVLRYGLTRDWVQGLKVITGTGEMLDLNKGLVKNATGYDLRHLFIGSEGTLGFIVEATMQLTAKPKPLSVVLLAVPALENIISILTEFRARVPLTAYEFFSDKALGHVLAHGSGARPFETAADFYALIEIENVQEATEADTLSAFEHCMEAGWATDGILSQNDRERAALWRYREGISESITPYTPYKNDVAVTISRVPAFLQAVDEAVARRYPDFEIVWFGHIGDGNLHLNILKPGDLAIDDFKAQCEEVSEEVMGIVQAYDGSVSAEHGVGLLKRNQLGYTRSRTEMDYMAAMKRVFDPNGVMNPGKLLI
jgi:FAD/FMN-containing dehydrogenase